MADSADGRAGEDAALVLEDRFAVVPEWLLDAPISDCAVRLYALLLRYGHLSGALMPSRATLARRLRKKSTDTIDRALRELVDLGAVTVLSRWSGRERLTNAYRVRTSRPERPGTATEADGSPSPPGDPQQGGRINAATPPDAASPIRAGGRTARTTGSRIPAAGVAAKMRPNREFLTDSPPPPPPSAAQSPGDVAVACGIADWDSFVASCQAARRRLDQPTGRWSGPCLDAALQLAVRARHWPADRAAHALLAVARDPATRSPMRVAEAGPWWDDDDTPPRDGAIPRPSKEEVEAAEAELSDAGGIRVLVQREARAQLASDGLPITRATVAVRALQLLRARDHVGASA